MVTKTTKPVPTPSEQRFVVLASPKGGVGKSTVGALLIEWCSHADLAVDLTDTDPNQTLRTWARYCHKESRPVLREGAPLVVVDTAGTSGSCLTWMSKAAVILCPFKANFADLDLLATWFPSLAAHLQQRFLFLPNMTGSAAEHKAGVAAITDLVRQTKRGKVLTTCTLRNRDAIYPEILKGLPKNFFSLGYRYKNAQEESSLMAQTVLKRLRSHASKGVTHGR